MTWNLATVTLYLFFSLPLAAWVGNTLFKRGRVFLLDRFDGDYELTDSVNHLLVVGFYLLNIGFIAMHAKETMRVVDLEDLFRTLTSNIGFVAVVLGLVHFFNLFVLTRIRSASS